ncbi:hypothetical protein [Dyella terrae]|uniref:hypothetical protein n=1 Tax=Dyella terrae TaxID=522259 RepID=UPI001EFED682|nr:hypothetical protein [Dyella terrae]ULU23171.1 hypothetical protein DYST_00062 [Dyella terrae]
MTAAIPAMDQHSLNHITDMTEEAKKADSKKVWVRTIGGALIGWGVVHFIGTAFGHSGADHVTSIGMVRLTSCEYVESYGDHTMGYKCVAKNWADEPSRPRAQCVSFDDHGRLIGSAMSIRSLSGETLGPGEERVVSLILQESAKYAECSDNGDIFTWDSLMKNKADLEKDKLITVVPL